MRRRTVPAWGALAAAAALPFAPAAASDGAEADSAHAREARWSLPPIRVTAEPLPDPLGPFPLATTRLDREALLRRPDADVAELLRPVAGLRVTSRGIAGSGVSIRGATTDQVLVLVDGRRWQSAQGGGADLGDIPLDAVESIDVFRGGASALFGPDALAGAIHIRTRPPRPGAMHVRAAGGSFGMRSLSGDAAAALGADWRLRGGARRFTTGGDYAYDDDRRADDVVVHNGDVSSTTADARLEGPTGGFGTMRWDAYALDGDRGVPGSEEFPTPTARLTDTRRALAGRWSSPAAEPWRGAVDVSWWSGARRYREDGAAFGPVDDRHENDRVRAELSLERVGNALAARWTGGASFDQLRSTTDGDRSRDTFDSGARASLDGTIAGRPVRVMGALRVDAVEGFDPAWSPRVGVLGTPVPGHLTLRASAGLSHRTPSFDELFWPPRASAAGNPDLAPERGRDLDAGFALGGLPFDGRVTVDAFLRGVDDLIQWIPGAGGVWRPHNVGAARISGVEASAGITAGLGGAGRLRVDGSATRLRSEDRSGEANVHGRELVYRPPWVADLSAAWEEPTGGELSGGVRVVDAVFVTRANTKSLPGYAIVDVRYRRPLAGGWSVDAALTNAGDRTARDFRDYPLPGRAFELGLAYRRDAS